MDTPQQFHNSSPKGTLFDTAGASEKSPMEEAFQDLGRILPSGAQVRSIAADAARKPVFWKVAAGLAGLLVVSVFGPGWAAFAAEKTRQGADWTVGATAEVGKTIASALSAAPGAGVFKAQRAAYYGASEFKDLNTAADAEAESALSLHPDTLLFADHRVDFHARLDGKPIRWAARAADAKNYHAFTLTQQGEQARLEIRTVVDGAVASHEDPIEVDAGLLRQGFNQITVVSRSNAVTTLVNGQGIHHLRHLSRDRGAVGFYADGDSARFGEIAVQANQDFWGRLLADARGLANL